MEPRSDDRGDEFASHTRDDDVDAAMEPRSDDRGDGHVDTGSGAEHLAAMEPRSDDRGDEAETGAAANFNVPQWSPARMTGETNEEAYQHVAGARAAMEPRSDDRGDKSIFDESQSMYDAAMEPRSDDRGDL